MKLSKFIYNEGQDAVDNALDTVFTQLMAYNKLYELLHKQIWRKAPYRISTYGTGTFNGRPITYITGWKLNSPSKSPYIYDGGDHTFGLNQLFVGQDYRKEYQGDPKDGIYHDTCSIVPRDISTHLSTWGYKTVWILSYADDGVDGGVTLYDFKFAFIGEDNDGNVLIDNVELVRYSVVAGSTTTYYRKIIVYKHNGALETYELGSYNIADIDTYDIFKTNTSYGDIGKTFQYSAWYKFGEDMSAHGAIVSQVDHLSNILAWNFSNPGWIRTYEDGTVMEFTPMADGGESGSTFSPTYRILPMMYTDTGDLTMDRIEFVEKWDTYFQLIVAEDSEWWSGFIKPVAIIITAIITYFTWGATSGLLAAVVAMGGTLTIIGIISDNQKLMLIGGIMMLGASVYTAVDAAVVNATSSVSLSTMSTGEALVGTSFQSTFSGYASAAGMDNLLVMPTIDSYTSAALEGIVATTAPYAEIGIQTAGMSVADYVSLGSSFGMDSMFSIGKDLYSLYNNISTFSNSATSSTNTIADPKQTKKVYYTASDERLFDPNKVIDNVINIL